MEYIKPTYQSNTFTCPHCNTLSQQKWQSLGFTEDFRGGRYTQIIEVSRCISCGQFTIWINQSLVYPTLSPPEPNKDMPQSVLDLYLEAGRIYSISPRAACALLRLSIDRLCNELGEKDSNLDKNIGALVQKGLPPGVQQALDLVRVVGNKAVHPGQIAFDVDDENTAIMLFKLINIITNHMVSEPNELKSLFDALPEKTKDAVVKRDKHKP